MFKLLALVRSAIDGGRTAFKTWEMMRLILIMLGIFGAASAVQAADASLPDPSTVKVPDVVPSRDPKVRDEGYKFYYFHNSSVTFAEAVQDVVECRAYLPIGGGVQVPGFVPWDEAQRLNVFGGVQPREFQMSPYGIVGGIMADIMLPKMERGVRSSKMRRCMGTRGYQRYAIPEATWNIINSGDERQIVLMQAKLAVGPRPQDEPVIR
jgi:hypothetical protein